MRTPKSLLSQSIFYIFLIFSYSSLHAATLLFDDGFESANISNFRCSGNCPSITTSPVKSGKYAGNFVLTPNMSINYRTEAVFRGEGHFQRGKEYWISMDYQYRDWKEDSSAEIAPFQVHSTPSSWSDDCKLGAAVTTAPFLMLTKAKEAFFKTYNGNILWRGSIQRNQWINIKVHFRMSSGNDGFIEAWKNGVKLGRVNGPTGPKNDNCGKPMRDDYLKIGIYKWDWRKQSTNSNRRQLLLDNIKIVEGGDGGSLIGPTSISVVAAPELSSNKLVAHWSMQSASGNTIPDVSGHGASATLVNGAQFISGQGVKFDGVNDYLDLGKIDINSNQITMSAWFWSKDLANCASNDCRIISKATGINPQDHYFMVSTIKVGSETRLRFRLKTNGVTSTLISDYGDIANNELVHVAAVYDGNTMRLYKDGVEVGSKAKTGSITTNSAVSAWIGNNPPNAGSRPWKGHIDDVRIYNYALTNGEIAALAK